ncbi:MAG: hypothetical protein AVDCRST_MAG73-684, partial [uncultured Thermomicrobiales bacterium]
CGARHRGGTTRPRDTRPSQSPTSRSPSWGNAPMSPATAPWTKMVRFSMRSSVKTLVQRAGWTRSTPAPGTRPSWSRAEPAQTRKPAVDRRRSWPAAPPLPVRGRVRRRWRRWCPCHAPVPG